MTLEPGARLGPHQIVAPLGAGGMGDCRAADDLMVATGVR